MKFFTNKGLSKLMIFLIILAVFILGWAWFSIGGIVEGSQALEADNIMGLASDAQNQLHMRRGRYSTVWTALNSGPLASYLNKKGDYVSNDGFYFMSRGGGELRPNKGYKMHFEENDQGFFVVAKRVHRRYRYTLVRSVDQEKTYCIPTSGNLLDRKFCMEFMNVTNSDQLIDPREPKPQEDVPFWN